jgi:hypothetical protein
MDIKLELPIFVRGRTKGARGRQNIFCKTVHVADVPEVGLSEMPVVFEVAKRIERLPKAGELTDRDDATPERLAAKRAELDRPFVLRTFEGAPYRRIAGSVAEAEALGLFADPFERRLSGRHLAYVDQSWQCDYGGDISPARVFRDNGPLARPLVDEFAWMLDRESSNVQLMKTAWPRNPVGRREDQFAGWNTHRNGVDIDDPAHGINDIDGDDWHTAKEMIRVQAGKLLLVDGEVWLRSRPPCYRVQHLPGYGYGPPGRVEVAMVTAPESYTGDLDVQHFSLADHDLAVQAADGLMARYVGREPVFRCDLVDDRVPFECHDDGLLDYDHEEEEINRFGYAAAAEITSFLKRNPKYADRLDESEIGMVADAFEEVRQVNHILGEHRDMTRFVPGLAAAWAALGHKQFLTGGVSVSAEAKTAATRALNYIDAAPIGVDAVGDHPLFSAR